MQLGSVRNFEEWRAAARPLLSVSKQPLRMPRPLFQLLECIAHYRDPGRWELMYRLAWRSLHDNPRLLEDHADRDVRRASLMERAVERDCHKMHAFVRFREVDRGGEPGYFAWFEPEHEILRRAVPFFCARFPNMNWMIATPDGAAAWQERSLNFIASPARADMPRDDAHEALWRTYYRSVCNTARINPKAMRREMPRRYWRNLPEAPEIAALIDGARAQFARDAHIVNEASVKSAMAASGLLASRPSRIEDLDACRRCELWRHATQAVRGEGPMPSALMLVGEQPGDEEDLRGRPFLGPAGHVLNNALHAAGIARDTIYVTNAVKHFKWEPRGKRRLHRKPDAREITACNGWLTGEISQVAPHVIVALGATAARSLLGATVSIEAARNGEWQHTSGARVVCTYHPAAILRAEGERAALLRQQLEQDLARARELAAAT